jgi:hypothetical protein
MHRSVIKGVNWEGSFVDVMTTGNKGPPLTLKSRQNMKKIFFTVFLLSASAMGTGAWAQTNQGNEKKQGVLDNGRDIAPGGHPAKKAKPVRKVSGTAKWGAKRVSPPPNK